MFDELEPFIGQRKSDGFGSSDEIINEMESKKLICTCNNLAMSILFRNVPQLTPTTRSSFFPDLLSITRCDTSATKRAVHFAFTEFISDSSAVGDNRRNMRHE